MNVRAEGEALDLQAVPQDLVVAFRQGTPVRLKDVAVVEDGLEDRRRWPRARRASPRMGFGIRKLRGANAVEVGERVHAKVEQIKSQPARGHGPRHQLRQHDLRQARRSTRSCFTLVLAALLTGLVCWVFLGSWSTHAERAAGHPHVHPGHVHRDVLLRLHAEHLHRAGPDAHRRHRGGRRHHGAGEHLPAPRARQGQGGGGVGRARARSPSRRPRPRSPSSPSSCRWPS